MKYSNICKTLLRVLIINGEYPHTNIWVCRNLSDERYFLKGSLHIILDLWYTI